MAVTPIAAECNIRLWPTQTWLLMIISCLGFTVIAKHSISVGVWLFNRMRAEKDLVKNYGSWALVTGATDGIGKALAHQLAQRGLNLVLVSRSSDKLETVSAEIQAKFPNICLKIIELDFSGDVSAGLRQIKEVSHDVDLGILINNVGITYPRAMFFHEVEESVWMKIVKVNLEVSTLVIKAVLAGMIERKRGAIVNIGSGAGMAVPSHPLYAIYAATKAYLNQLSRCLYAEYKHVGIHVQCQVPLYVATKMLREITSISRASLFVPSAEDYAEAAVRQIEIGYEAVCCPYWAHSLQWQLAQFVPHSLLDAWRLSVGLRRRSTLHPQFKILF
ncbi:hypothetical protein L6164_010712 [Bauhinia variegata]|uniref:Uncharacterized protein n=1 Tax=Bauhinia variegata TaxID=167791 RepID=A0ACB9P7E3_BAUVA|nr:hypothetical protein L6164_010712 [Bauhinia variegata]